MQYKVFVAMIVAVLVMSLSSMTVCAQEAQSNDVKIRSLREEVQKREAIDRDQSMPADLHVLNHNVLMQKHAELRTLLGTEIDNLRAYKTKLGTLITPEETQKIGGAIQGYEAEIKRLGEEMKDSLASEMPTAEPSQGDSSQPTDASATPQTSPTASSSPAPIEPISTGGQAATPKTEQLSCAEIKSQNPKTVPEIDSRRCALVDSIIAHKRSGKRRPLVLNSPDTGNLVVIMIAKRDTPTFLLEAEESRVDKQVGGGPANSGSTSLVVKGGTPAILGFAVENGALTQSVDGTTITFRGNPLGIYHALSSDGFFDSYIEDEKDPITRFLRKTSFSASFDTDRGKEPGVFTGSKQQLSAFSARIEFINQRRPSLYAAEWENFLKERAQPLSDAVLKLIPTLVDTKDSVNPSLRDPAMQEWFVKTQQDLAAASEDQIEAVFNARLDKLPVQDLSPQTVTELNGVEDQLGLYLSGRDELLKKIAKGTLVTFDYTNNREVSAPDTSNFRFIAEKGTGGRVDLTFNGALTIFNKKPALSQIPNSTTGNVSRIRDFQFAGQVDVPFGSVRTAGLFLLSFAGRYERLMENASTQVGTMMPNTKGDIAVGQIKLMIPIKNLGIQFPISISFANRTELIKEKEIRGNFGFTFDLNSIFARFNPFSQK